MEDQEREDRRMERQKVKEKRKRAIKRGKLERMRVRPSFWIERVLFCCIRFEYLCLHSRKLLDRSMVYEMLDWLPDERRKSEIAFSS